MSIPRIYPVPIPLASVFTTELALVQRLPLFGGVALGRPGVDGSDLGLEGRVHQAMASKHGLLLELGGDNDGLESLSATTCRQQNRQHLVLESYSCVAFIHFLMEMKLISRRFHTRQVFNLNMLRLQLIDQFALQRLGRNARSIGHGCVDCRKGARGNRERRFVMDGGAEKIPAASAQQGSGAGVHQASRAATSKEYKVLE